jgi:hypothetical protein
MTGEKVTWIIAALLGMYHGLNPAMGWLFAAALGLQERRASAVLRAIPPIVLGHAASVTVVIALATGAERFISIDTLRIAGAVILLVAAIALIARRWHPQRVGMRIGARGLVAWSFVMSSAHGAGLMLLPILLARSNAGSSMHAHHGLASAGTFALVAHTAAMLIAMTGAALVAYRLSGVSFLRYTWVDTSLVWSVALAASGVVVLVS